MDKESNMKIFVLDNRKGPAEFDVSETGPQDIIISVEVDTVYVTKNNSEYRQEIYLLEGRSEPEISMDKALAEKAARLAEKPEVKPAHTTAQHLSRVFLDSNIR